MRSVRSSAAGRPPRAPLPAAPAAAAGAAAEDRRGERLGEPEPAGGDLHELLAQDARRHRPDHLRDLGERLVAALGGADDRAVERPLDPEARERHRPLDQRSHLLGTARPSDDVGRIGPGRQRHDAHLAARRRDQARGADHRLLAGRVGVEAEHDGVREALELDACRSVSAVPISPTALAIPAWRSAMTSV